MNERKRRKVPTYVCEELTLSVDEALSVTLTVLKLIGYVTIDGARQKFGMFWFKRPTDAPYETRVEHPDWLNNPTKPLEIYATTDASSEVSYSVVFTVEQLERVEKFLSEHGQLVKL